MVNSQNGYPANDPSLIHRVVVPGTTVQLAVRKGPAGDLLIEAARRWNLTVEPLQAPDGVLDCWGFAERLIRGSLTMVSNHASGTAIDLRAREHPLGVDESRSFTPAQIVMVHAIVDAAGGCLRWGGDYIGRQDPMHIEINAPEAHCAAVLPYYAYHSTEGPDEMQESDRLPDLYTNRPDDSLTVGDTLAWACAHAANARDAARAAAESAARMEAMLNKLLVANHLS